MQTQTEKDKKNNTITPNPLHQPSVFRAQVEKYHPGVFRPKLVVGPEQKLAGMETLPRLSPDLATRVADAYEQRLQNVPTIVITAPKPPKITLPVSSSSSLPLLSMFSKSNLKPKPRKKTPARARQRRKSARKQKRRRITRRKKTTPFSFKKAMTWIRNL